MRRYSFRHRWRKAVQAHANFLTARVFLRAERGQPALWTDRLLATQAFFVIVQSLPRLPLCGVAVSKNADNYRQFLQFVDKCARIR
jgi:hypothetical protein